MGSNAQFKIAVYGITTSGGQSGSPIQMLQEILTKLENRTVITYRPNGNGGMDPVIGVDLDDIRISLKNTTGIKLEDDQYSNQFPEPIKVENKNDVMVGRIRYDLSDPTNKTINLFLCGDQLLKGAALNAYQILRYYKAHLDPIWNTVEIYT